MVSITVGLNLRIFYISFQFLDQTCQIGYDCWPNDIKFSFDATCQIVTSHVSSRQNGMREGEDGLDDVEK